MELDATKLGKCTTFLFDIEGTICSIAFVKDVLYPFFVQDLPQYIQDQWTSPSVQQVCSRLPAEIERQPDAVRDYFLDLVQRDVKDSVLKELQGLIWTSGYESGAITAPLYPDVIPALRTIREHNRSLAIYSSGSVYAQRLLFDHVDVENFPLLQSSESADTPAKSGVRFERDTSTAQSARKSISIVEDFVGEQSTDPTFFDTVNAGPKTEEASYEKIVKLLGYTDSDAASSVVFFTDNPKEAEASRDAGLYTIVLVRPGNAPLPDGLDKQFPVVRDLSGVEAIVRQA